MSFTPKRRGSRLFADHAPVVATEGIKDWVAKQVDGVKNSVYDVVQFPEFAVDKLSSRLQALQAQAQARTKLQDNPAVIELGRETRYINIGNKIYGNAVELHRESKRVLQVMQAIEGPYAKRINILTSAIVQNVFRVAERDPGKASSNMTELFNSFDVPELDRNINGGSSGDASYSLHFLGDWGIGKVHENRGVLYTTTTVRGHGPSACRIQPYGNDQVKAMLDLAAKILSCAGSIERNITNGEANRTYNRGLESLDRFFNNEMELRQGLDQNPNEVVTDIVRGSRQLQKLINFPAAVSIQARRLVYAILEICNQSLARAYLEKVEQTDFVQK